MDILVKRNENEIWIDLYHKPTFLLIYLEVGFLCLTYLTVVNLVRLRIYYLVRFPSLRCITSGRTIHPLIERLSPPAGIEHTPFRNTASKVTGVQGHATLRRYFT